MIYVDESTIKIGGIILPGLFKSIEVKGDALIEEQEVEGRSKKPKQATGYEDAKVNLELVLYDGPTLTKLEKLEMIQNLFKKNGQAKPIVHEIINEHTAARGITKVLFKNLTTKEQSKKDEMLIMIEFWEYDATTITAIKGNGKTAKNSAKNATVNLNPDYQSYLNNNRGAAPKLQDKTSKSTAIDNANAQIYKSKILAMQY